MNEKWIDPDKKKKVKKIGEVTYISKKKFKKVNPMDGVGYSILGFIGDGVGEVIGEWEYNAEKHSYYEFKKKCSIYQIIGYIQVEEDGYIVIIQRKILKKLFMLLIFLALLGGLIGFILAPKGPDLEDGMDKYIPKTDLRENFNSTSIVLPGYRDLNMEADTDTAYVALYNPEGNPCYFKFKITLQESGEVIYQSKMIPPGYAVTTVKYDRQFPEGLYPVSINIETFSLDDYTENMNGGDIQATIVSIRK